MHQAAILLWATSSLAHPQIMHSVTQLLSSYRSLALATTGGCYWALNLTRPIRSELIQLMDRTVTWIVVVLCLARKYSRSMLALSMELLLKLQRLKSPSNLSAMTFTFNTVIGQTLSTIKHGGHGTLRQTGTSVTKYEMLQKCSHFQASHRL